MNPGMEQSALYRIECFEQIAGFPRVKYLDRIQYPTRTTWRLRDLKIGSILDGNYLVSSSVERLVLEWKFTRGRWVDKRDGVYDGSNDELSAEFDCLLCKAGSAAHDGSKISDAIDEIEYRNLLTALAPNESDGPGDNLEWNLFNQYLDSNSQALDNSKDLSFMLRSWQADVKLAREDEVAFDETQMEAKYALGEKAIRALKRLSGISMLNMQASLLA
ncbi:hypothetical protein N7456_006919 [Penicillium angulare]|uniref:Uncharacterized protein n=1 Tax=Penicillium angulare TaxID=116970 RepID=A0A9W9FJ05_9EURO|nr:hypothetical protein N7456_006919 [Penicillium angulare]